MTHTSDTSGLELTSPTENSHNFKLSLVQQPSIGKSLSSNSRARGIRWPIEPPPVLELKNGERAAEKWLFIHNPNWFCVADIITLEVKRKNNNSAEAKKDNKEGSKDNLSGLLASSLHKIKNPEDRHDHGYFVFGDLNVRDPGVYKLKFSLFEMRRYDTHVYAAKLDEIISQEFEIFAQKVTMPTKDSTKLSKVLSESGVKLRLRKESTKRKQAHFNWSSTTNENFSFGSNRPHPATLAPMMNPGMAPPPVNPNTRLGRNSGEDISRRLSVVQNDMSEQTPVSQPQMSSPLEAQYGLQSQINPYTPMVNDGMGPPSVNPQARLAGNTAEDIHRRLGVVQYDMSGQAAVSQTQMASPMDAQYSLPGQMNPFAPHGMAPFGTFDFGRMSTNFQQPQRELPSYPIGRPSSLGRYDLVQRPHYVCNCINTPCHNLGYCIRHNQDE